MHQCTILRTIQRTILRNYYAIPQFPSQNSCYILDIERKLYNNVHRKYQFKLFLLINKQFASLY